MRPDAEYLQAIHLLELGLDYRSVGRHLGLSPATVKYWWQGGGAKRRARSAEVCARCAGPAHRFPESEYAYLLGMYLGDGVISQTPRTWKLRISFDMSWLGIYDECLRVMRAVFPDNKVSVCQPDPNSSCVVSTLYSNQLPCLFPQHGPGLKHLRRIELADWQQEIVNEHPEKFVRGLIHSDGSRFMNRVRIKGKEYAYPRYNFTNASGDIRGLFTDALDRLGIAWRRMNERNISVARREAVARLDEFVGPKY
jgi:hypothetical protein